MAWQQARLAKYKEAVHRVSAQLSKDDLALAGSWADNWSAGEAMPPESEKPKPFNPANPSGEHTGWVTWTGKPKPHVVEDGPVPKVGFNDPQAVVVDSAGNLLIADAGNELVRRISPDGMVTTLAGQGGIWGNLDGPGHQASFNQPSAIAVGADGTIYVADTSNATVRAISAAGIVRTLAGWAELTPRGWAAHEGYADGQGTAAHFMSPQGIAVDADGNVYVSDATTIRRISAAGMVSTFAGKPGYTGSDDGVGLTARFDGPGAMTLDGGGNLYVVEGKNDDIRKISPQGVVTRIAGLAGHAGDENGPAANARFDDPSGIAVDKQGNVFVTDSGNHKIKKISPAGEVSTLATLGRHKLWFSDDSQRLSGLAIDRNGNLFVLTANTVLKVTSGGVVSVYAGRPQ